VFDGEADFLDLLGVVAQHADDAVCQFHRWPPRRGRGVGGVRGPAVREKRNTRGGETIRGGASRAGVKSFHRRGHINRPPLYGGTNVTRMIHSACRVVNWKLSATWLIG
jgi:hypothetical protein